MQTTIVVPCHNEARRLDVAEFRRFVAVNRHVRFLLVNDGSTDETPALLDQLVSSDPLRFASFHLTKNSGKAEAVRRGVLEAARGQPEYIGYWDADLATPLNEIPRFVDAMNRRPEVTLVLGSRLMLLGHNIRRRKVRRLLGRLFSRVTSLVLGLRVHDTQCGAKLFRATPSMLTAFSHPFASRWIFDVELLARMIRMSRDQDQGSGGVGPERSAQPSAFDSTEVVAGRLPASAICESSPSTSVHPRTCLYEHPLDQWRDVAGSKLRRGDFFKAIGELSAIWWRYLRPAAGPFVSSPLETGDPSTAGTPIRRAA